MSTQTSPIWDAHPWVAEARSGVRFGVLAMGGSFGDRPGCLDLAQQAEELGFDAFWVTDHPAWWAECWTTLTALALRTRTIRLGSMVSCVSYRHPALLARIAADVDRASNGRLVVGLGLGDSEHEFVQLGIPFPPPRERYQALRETIEIVRGAWKGQPFTFQGEQFRVLNLRLDPPVQSPRVPLLIGGGGEGTTLRQVARFADAANVGSHQWTGDVRDATAARRKLDALRRHCDDLGRPYESILKSHVTLPMVLAESREQVNRRVAAMPQIVGMFAGTPTEAIAYYRDLADAGLQYFVAGVWGCDTETVDLLGREVLPVLALPHKTPVHGERPRKVATTPGGGAAPTTFSPRVVTPPMAASEAYRPGRDFRVIALISAYNEGDVISEIVRHLIEDGVSVYLLDNHSTDDTVEQARPWLGRGLLEIERFPRHLPGQPVPDRFVWSDILRRKEQLAQELQADWFLHQDADEIREPPWPGATLSEAIRWVDTLGYNCIDFQVLNFVPVDDGFRQGMDPKQYFTHYQPCGWFDLLQRKCWKAGAGPVSISALGGHDVRFEGRRVFPLRFLLRHYPIRGQTHGLRKVFAERKARFLASERSRGWHQQYDQVTSEDHNFMADPSSLTAFDQDQVRLRLLLENGPGWASGLPAEASQLAGLLTRLEGR